MAFSNINNLNHGDFLQIQFSDGLRSQLSADYRDWEQVQMYRVGNPEGYKQNFLFQNSYGMAAIQYRNPNFSSNFPTSQQLSSSEHSAVYKELDVTIEIESNLYRRLQESKKARYADAFAAEIQAKTTGAKKKLAADFYCDGTGVVGQASSVVDTTGAGGYATVTLDSTDAARGHIGFFELGDLVLNYNLAGTPDNPTVVGTFYAWRVKSKDRKNNKVVLEAVDSSYSVLNLTASSIDATDVFYRVGQPSIPDLSSAIADYGQASEVIAGLESLVNNDGRVIHGITMSGATASYLEDAGATQLDVSHIQSAMDQAKILVGQSAYSWKKMCMAPEAQATLIDSREDDRRFITVDDNKRGIKFFAYVHGNDVLEAYTSEYCPKKRIYILPESKNGQGKVLEFYGSDFKPVGDEMMLKPSSLGGHERRYVQYMEALGVLICKHPAAIPRIHNFTF